MANTEETITMCCIRCNVAMPLDGGTPHCPCDGISLLATGNWPSSVWDEERSAWFVLCDECANKMLFDEKYCLEEIRVLPESHFIPIER